MSFRRVSLLYPLIQKYSKLKGANCLNAFQAVRNSHAVNYRTAPTGHSKATLIGAEIISGAMWYWILWHLWHEYDHITGEFEYPDTNKWTNAELGIPS